MENYRKLSHTVYDSKCHIVWITKYRRPVLRANIVVRLRNLIREICKSRDLEITEGHVSWGHVHIIVSGRMPPVN